MMDYKKSAPTMKLIKLLRKPKLNPRLEVMRFAVYGIALGAAFLVLKPEILVLTGEVSCRWNVATKAMQMDGCEHPSEMKQQSTQDEANDTSSQGTSR